MLVLVEDAAEAITSSYVEAGQLVRVGDVRGQRIQRACVRDALVWAVSVVELFELAQGVEQVPLVPEQGPVQQFTAAGLYPALHERVHSRHTDTAEDDVDARVGQNGVEQGGELPIAVPDQKKAPG
jgi:hypothetical protein